MKYSWTSPSIFYNHFILKLVDRDDSKWRPTATLLQNISNDIWYAKNTREEYKDLVDSTKHHLINIGTGKDYPINFFAKQILKTLIPEREIIIKYDKSKPNGTPRKVLDISLAKKYGWKAKSNFQSSILETYNSFKKKVL